MPSSDPALVDERQPLGRQAEHSRSTTPRSAPSRAPARRAARAGPDRSPSTRCARKIAASRARGPVRRSEDAPARWNQPSATAAAPRNRSGRRRSTAPSAPRREGRRPRGKARYAPLARLEAERDVVERHAAHDRPSQPRPNRRAQGGVERGPRLLPGAAGERLAPGVEGQSPWARVTSPRRAAGAKRRGIARSRARGSYRRGRGRVRRGAHGRAARSRRPGRR